MVMEENVKVKQRKKSFLRIVVKYFSPVFFPHLLMLMVNKKPFFMFILSIKIVVTRERVKIAHKHVSLNAM